MWVKAGMVKDDACTLVTMLVTWITLVLTWGLLYQCRQKANVWHDALCAQGHCGGDDHTFCGQGDC